MWPVLGATVDFLHALSMAVWLVGLPLIFWKSRPRLRRAYAIYAIVFIVMNQLSHFVLGECFLTTISRFFWERTPEGGAKNVDEWFTVRIAQAVFDMTPSHRTINILTQILVLLTAAGALYSLAGSGVFSKRGRQPVRS